MKLYIHSNNYRLNEVENIKPKNTINIFSMSQLYHKTEHKKKKPSNDKYVSLHLVTHRQIQ